MPFCLSGCRPVTLCLVITACASPLCADVMLQFQVDRPGAPVHGLTVTTVGTGSFVWQHASDAAFAGAGRFVAGEHAQWVTTVSGGIGGAARFNGVYLPSSQQVGGVRLTSSRTGGYWIHHVSSSLWPVAVRWEQQDGDITLSCLGLSGGNAVPIVGQTAVFRAHSPSLLLLSVRDEFGSNLTLQPKPALLFEATAQRAATIPEPAAAPFLMLLATFSWTRFGRTLRSGRAAARA